MGIQDGRALRTLRERVGKLETVIIQAMESVVEIVMKKHQITMLSVWTAVDLLPVVGSFHILEHIISPTIVLLMAM